jgi:endonuclease YncB( thermonuclease family)
MAPRTVLRGLVLSAIMTVAAAAPAGAQCELETGERVRITRAIDGDTVAIEGGGEVRLVGIQAPKLALGRAGFAEWPLAPEARAQLATLAEGRQAELRYGGARDDRHGRRLAHVFVTGDGGGTWLQGAMLEAGLARVYSFPDNRSCVAEMLALERAARIAGRGIWSDPYYALRDAAAVGQLENLDGTFQLVEGRVEAVAIVRGRVYLNFDQDFRQDFTVTIDPRDTRRFAERGEALRNLEGETVRVRGWLATINGPMIEATHPEQIELLDAPDGRP